MPVNSNTTTATYLTILQQGKVNKYLNDGATFSWFSGRSLPYASYGIDWVTYPVATSISLTEPSAEIEIKAKRQGDRFRRTILEITAPVLCTVSSAAQTKAGAASNSGFIQYLVDDVTTAASALTSTTTALGAADATGFAAAVADTLVGRVTLLSTYLKNMSPLADGDAAAVSATYGTSASSGGSIKGAVCLQQYFPLHEAVAAYTNYAPAAILNQASFDIQDVAADTVTGRHCVLYQELYASAADGTSMDPESLHCSLNRGDRVAWSNMRERTWLLPLPFFYTHSYGVSFPARGAHNHTLAWKIMFNPAAQAIESYVGEADNSLRPSGLAAAAYSSGPSSALLWTTRTTPTGKLNQGLSPLFSTSASTLALPGTVITAAMFQARLHVEVISTGKEERQAIHNTKTQMVVSLFKDLVSKPITNTNFADGTTLGHTVTPKLVVQSTIMTCQRGSALAQNKRFDYSGVASPFYRMNGLVQDAQPMLSSIKFALSDDTKFDYSPADFRLHLSSYTKRPECTMPGLYLYAWGIGNNPFDQQKRGGAALGLFDDCAFTLTPNSAATVSHIAEGGISGETATFLPTNVVVNVLDIGDGMASMLWS